MLLKDIFSSWAGIGIRDAACDWGGLAMTMQLLGMKSWAPAMLSIAIVLLALAASETALIPANRAANPIGCRHSGRSRGDNASLQSERLPSRSR
jgi:hypothetical protein